jgi:hypothetical protein
MECKGKTMKGKDGMYISKPDKNNIYKWVKTGANKKTRKAAKETTMKASKNAANNELNLDGVKKPKHKYFIHDNRSRPYVVYDYGNNVTIYGQKYDLDTNKEYVTKKLHEIKYKKIFLGDNVLKLKRYESGKGNSILLQTGPSKYVYIGDGIREFSTKDGDVIEKYQSGIGNNDVPYPYAIGKKYTYFMLDDGTVKEGPKFKYVSNDEVDLTVDAYDQLYGWSEMAKNKDGNKRPVTNVNSKSKTYAVKILQKRGYS